MDGSSSRFRRECHPYGSTGSQSCFRRRTSRAPQHSWDESFPWASLKTNLSCNLPCLLYWDSPARANDSTHPTGNPRCASVASASLRPPSRQIAPTRLRDFKPGRPRSPCTHPPVRISHITVHLIIRSSFSLGDLNRDRNEDIIFGSRTLRGISAAESPDSTAFSFALKSTHAGQRASGCAPPIAGYERTQN